MNYKKIGQYICQKRKDKGYTQDELAKKIYVSAKTISKWETGKGFPSVEYLKPLTEELGITLNELLNGEDIKEEKKDEMYNKTILSILKEDKRKKWVIFSINILEFIITLVLFAYLYAKGYGDEVAILFLMVILIVSLLTELEVKIKSK